MSQTKREKAHKESGGTSSTEYVIRDTEYTSWLGCNKNGRNNDEGHYKELVQVGAIKVSRKNNAILEERLWYVLPELNKDLSEYFIELTGITQEKLMAEGTSFDSFNREFGKFVDGCELYSFGGDYLVYVYNCGLHQSQYHLQSTQCKDIRESMSATFPGVWDKTSGTIHHLCGLEDTEREHDALGDAKNIWRVVQQIKLSL